MARGAHWVWLVLPRPSVHVQIHNQFMDQTLRSRSYVFTWNNYTKEDEERLQQYWESGKFKYLCYGREVGASGTPHLQGLLYMANACTLTSLKKHFPSPHFERMRGTFSQAIAYCKKDGDFVGFGSEPQDSVAKGAVEKARWSRTLELAKAGRIEEIDPDMQIRFDLLPGWVEFLRNN